jgi:hypothetical protein
MCLICIVVNIFLDNKPNNPAKLYVKAFQLSKIEDGSKMEICNYRKSWDFKLMRMFFNGFNGKNALNTWKNAWGDLHGLFNFDSLPWVLFNHISRVKKSTWNTVKHFVKHIFKFKAVDWWIFIWTYLHLYFKAPESNLDHKTIKD